jgi:phage shock protein E
MDSNTIMYLVAAALAAFLVFQRLRSRKAPAALVREKIAAGAKIIDVRSPGEFSASSYPKAKNIPLDALPSRLAELPKDKPIVLYCASGARSAQAVRLLKGAGYTDVLSAGGLSDMPR